MAKYDDELDWEKLKQGRLEEGNHDELGLTGSGRGARQSPVYLRLMSRPAPRRVAPTQAGGAKGGIAYRAEGARGLAPFHFAHSFVSRPRTRTRPRAVVKGERVQLFPRKAQVARLRAIPEARYHNRHRVWTIPKTHPFARSPEGQAMRNGFAGIAHYRRRAGQGAARRPDTARAFQDYIERAQAGDAKRAEEVESDAKGPISTGSLGPTVDDRRAFWRAVEVRERRDDARLQCRIIAELPHWLEPADRREIVERFGEIFDARGLGWWAAVHRPDVGKGSDARNFHLHVVYHDRPVSYVRVRFDESTPDSGFVPASGSAIEPSMRDDGIFMQRSGIFMHPETPRVRIDGFAFDERKDRGAQGEEWVIGLKRRYAEIVNDVVSRWATREGQTAPFWYFPGGYADLGIEIEGQRHLGAKRTALERFGVATLVGRANVDRADPAGDAAVERYALRWRRARLAAAWGLRKSAQADPESAIGARLQAAAQGVTEAGSGAARAGKAFYEAVALREEPLDAPAVRDALAGLRDENSVLAPTPARELRLEVRVRAFDRLTAAEPSGSRIGRELAQRKAELVAWEGAATADEAVRARRRLEGALTTAASRYEQALARFEKRAEAAAWIAIASELAKAYAAWRRWCGGSGRVEARALPPGLDRLPTLSALPTGWEAQVAVPAPKARRRNDGVDETVWIERAARRRMSECAELARLLARIGTTGARLETALAAEIGVAAGGVGDAFDALAETAGARVRRPAKIRERD
ncbi:MAG: MobA/MobL family protein [Alphaproteobacteria bacterium]|nr:MobA/MobL family protein [Alphaproteobacteria bacterium]